MTLGVSVETSSSGVATTEAGVVTFAEGIVTEVFSHPGGACTISIHPRRGNAGILSVVARRRAFAIPFQSLRRFHIRSVTFYAAVSRMISRSGVCGLNFTTRSSFSTSGLRRRMSSNTGALVTPEPLGVGG